MRVKIKNKKLVEKLLSQVWNKRRHISLKYNAHIAYECFRSQPSTFYREWLTALVLFPGGTTVPLCATTTAKWDCLHFQRRRTSSVRVPGQWVTRHPARRNPHSLFYSFSSLPHLTSLLSRFPAWTRYSFLLFTFAWVSPFYAMRAAASSRCQFYYGLSQSFIYRIFLRHPRALIAMRDNDSS